MKRLNAMSRTSRVNFLTYALVIAAFVVLQALSMGGGLSATLQGQLVPVCAYVVMALSLNLTVGVLGELSLGHAGFMSVGAFSGAVAASALQGVIPASGVRLALAMLIGAVFAGIVGTLISVPVLRLNGDYLAIVTLAFGQIIKSIIENLYVGVDGSDLHFSFLKPTVTLEQGGRMILNGPMGIPNIEKISTFLAGFLLTVRASSITPVMYVAFALVGLAWAAINVNSLPMVVEMCRGSDVGKFTGYYYTASMLAQVVTPVLAGSLMKAVGYHVLFPYAAFFVACSFVTMCFVRHGDSRAEARTGLDAFEDID